MFSCIDDMLSEVTQTKTQTQEQPVDINELAEAVVKKLTTKTDTLTEINDVSEEPELSSSINNEPENIETN